MKMKMRVNKFLSECGIDSRRKCDLLIHQGRVKINGNVAEPGMLVDVEKDEVLVDGKPVTFESKKKYILLHKPRGVVTTVRDDRGRKTVLDLIPNDARFFPVGRLDRDTSGALLLTNDGDLAYQLTHPKFGVEKVYVVKLMKPISAADVKRVAAGIMLEDGIAVPVSIRILNREKTQVELILSEGRNREVRRIFEAVGNRVRRLKRVRFANLTVKNMKPGEYRFLSPKEVAKLRNLIDARKSE